METEDVVYKIAEMFSTGDVSEAERVFSSDYIDHQQPSGMDLKGPDEFKAIVELARNGMPNLSVEVADSIAEGNRVAARFLWHFDGESGPTRETLEILHLMDGKVVEHWGAKVVGGK